MKADFLLRMLVERWEKLPGGQHYSANRVAEWLMRDMKPAIDLARIYLNARGDTSFDVAAEVKKILQIRSTRISELREILGLDKTTSIKYVVDDAVYSLMQRGLVRLDAESYLHWTGRERARYERLLQAPRVH